MAVEKLYVEGKLDNIIFTKILAGQPGVVRGDGKDNARRKTLVERAEGRSTYFVRDRDFDYDPSYQNQAQPIREHGQLVGWHWSRHEIENYLLEPGVFGRAFEGRVTEEEYREQLTKSAESIRYYQMARWAVGRVRRHTNLPNPRGIETNQHRNDYRLPENLEFEPCRKWAMESTEEFLTDVVANVSGQRIDEEIQKNVEMFTLEKCSDIEWSLHTFSGKDLFGGMNLWLQGALRLTASETSSRIGLWVSENPEEALRLLPEWKGFVEVVRSST